MLQLNTPYPPSLRAPLRFQALFLFFSLIILLLTCHEFGFGPPQHVVSTPTNVVGCLGDYDRSAINKDYAAHHLPAVLRPAFNLSSCKGLRRSGNRSDDYPPIQPHLSWAVVSSVPRLPSLRIDPIAWDSRTPSFLLPSAYGLVTFAIPPPLCLA